MFIAQISDTHLLPLTGNDPLAAKRAENLERCVNTINQMNVQPQAVVHTGDMINFSEENGYGLAFEILSQLKTPFFPAVGNRDSQTHLINQFLAPHILPANAPFCQYRVALKDADLICVDTKSPTRNIGATCDERLKQLDHLLSQDQDKPVFVFLHHPPTRIEALKNPWQFENMEMASALTERFDQYDNIVRILCGHTHRSDIVQMGRHIASTHPSLATDVRLDAYPARLIEEPVFQIHQLQDNLSVASMSYFANPTLPKRKAA